MTKKILLLIAFLSAATALAVGFIQNEDVKSLSDIEQSNGVATGNLSTSSVCVTSLSFSVGSYSNLATGLYVYDSSNPTYISSGVTIVGLPGTCSTGQVQMSADPTHNATGDTITFGGSVAQLVGSSKIYDSTLAEQLSTAISGNNLINTSSSTAATVPAAITFSGNITSGTVAGGSSASSVLNLESTSGSGTSDYIAFSTGSQSERMRIVTGGDVGVGTTAPGAKLEVNGTGLFDSTITAASGSTITGNASASYVSENINNTNSGGYAQLNFYVGSSGANGQASINYAPGTLLAIGVTGNDTTSPLYLETDNGSKRLTILSGGNVGIGTTIPNQTLEVNGETQIDGILRVSGGSNPNAADAAYFWNQGGVGPTITGGNFEVNTGSTGSTSLGLEVDSGGTVHIPRTTTGTAADVLCLTSSGNIILQAAGSCTISKRALKEKIAKLDPQGIKEIMALQPVSFVMKDREKKNPDNVNFKNPQLGFIAEDIAAVDPRLALYEDDNKTPKGYRPESMIAILVKAVQEQQQEIEQLKTSCSASK